MPGFYADGEYDLAGTMVGAVSREKLITGAGIEPGDVLLGLPSTGLHTNGYSLARKLLFEVAGYGMDEPIAALGGTPGGVLMAVHRSYLRPIAALVEAGCVAGMAHITGGGITENLPRVLPPGCGAVVRGGSMGGAARVCAPAGGWGGRGGGNVPHLQYGDWVGVCGASGAGARCGRGA